MGTEGKEITTFDKILSFDNIKVFILPDESTSNAQN
jgi:hypothetical protein